MSDTVAEQIEAMLNPVEPTEDLPEPDPPVEDPPVEPEPEPEPAPEPDAEPTPDPEPAPDPEPEPEPEPEPVDELKTLQEENERLRKQVENAHVKKTPEPDPPADPEPDPEPEPIQEIDFLGSDLDLDELSRDPKVFNTILNKVLQAGIEQGQRMQEDTVRGIPDIVKSNITTQTALKKEVDKFYTDNEDLKPFKKVVAVVYEELTAENPEWKMSELFENVGKEARNRLELHRKAITPDPEPGDPKLKPKFPKSKLLDKDLNQKLAIFYLR